MKLIVGLGNPEPKYLETRHNVGFLFLDSLVHELPNAHFEKDKYLHAELLEHNGVVLAKPTTFMNASGKAVKALVEKLQVPLDNVFIVHDDLDLRIGEYKIQKGVGPKLHNGVSSIEASLGSKDFWRIRIGVDNRDPDNRVPGEAYVLEKFLESEKSILQSVFTKIMHEKNFLLSR